MEREKNGLLILSSTVVLLSLFLLLAPQNVVDKTGIGKLPLVSQVRNKFNQELDIEIILTGDVMLGRTVMTTSLDKNDPTYPFKKVADTLKSADLVFVNLETPIIENCPRKTDGLIFCADPEMIAGLTSAGVDVVTLANNHTSNYGEEGLRQTKKFLSENGIEYTDNSLAVKEVGGATFGFLGFEFVDKNITDQEIELVKAVETQVDILIVGVHWGAEYQAVAGQRQREIAQKLVEAGADVVVGHHPHWVQDTEMIENKPIYYSLGNFVFDQMWSEETRKGLAVRLIFDKRGNLEKEEKLPIYMKDWAQPEFVK